MDRSDAGHEDPRGPLVELVERYGLFVPVGFVASVARSVPGSVDELADRGRAEVLQIVERLEMQIRTARVLGQFAAPRVRHVLAERLEQQRAARAAAAPTRPRPRPESRPESRPAPRSAPRSAPPSEAAPAAEPSPPPTGAPRTTRPGPRPAGRRTPAGRPASPAETTRAGQLPIEGYDQLGASQIVARLDGLTPGELESVRTYEQSGRQRRTILTRIQQLLAEPGR
jgi:hypothetical protein